MGYGVVGSALDVQGPIYEGFLRIGHYSGSYLSAHILIIQRVFPNPIKNSDINHSSKPTFIPFSDVLELPRIVWWGCRLVEFIPSGSASSVYAVRIRNRYTASQHDHDDVPNLE